MSNLVPFGKYKGKPVEDLAADVNYLGWLRSQTWFSDRYPQIDKAIIVVQHGAQEPSETPEHNKLQACFLDPDFIRAFFFHQIPKAANFPDQVNAYRLKILKFLEPVVQSRVDSHKVSCLELHGRIIDSDYHVQAVVSERKRLQDLLDFYQTLMPPINLEWIEIWNDVEFEKGGVDVTLRFSLSCDLDPNLELSHLHENRVDAYYRGDSKFCGEHRSAGRWSIECKPTVGDDYPAILRQMNANGSDVLLYMDLTSSVLNHEQLTQFFGASGLDVVRLDDVLSTIKPEWMAA
jgi:hypothetical protein